MAPWSRELKKGNHGAQMAWVRGVRESKSGEHGARAAQRERAGTVWLEKWALRFQQLEGPHWLGANQSAKRLINKKPDDVH